MNIHFYRYFDLQPLGNEKEGPETTRNAEGVEIGRPRTVLRFQDGKPAGTCQTFADGFWHENGTGPQHRPVGLAQGPDGSLYVTDDAAGRIWRIIYKGR